MAVKTFENAQARYADDTRVPFWRHWRQWLPSVLWVGAAILLLVSISMPYWGMVLEAPQYPGGLRMRVFVNEMTGDEDPRLDEVAEINGLNHYIGMLPLETAATFERSVAIPAIITFAVLLIVAALFPRRRLTWLLTIPALTFPFVFIGDMAYWLNHHGQNLDPYAPLSSAIRPFTPPILGEGVIGQFKTVASLDQGFYLAAGASLLIVIGLVVRFLNARSQS